METDSPDAHRDWWIPVEFSAACFKTNHRSADAATPQIKSEETWEGALPPPLSFLSSGWNRNSITLKKIWILNKDVKQTAHWSHETPATVPMLQWLQRQWLYMWMNMVGDGLRNVRLHFPISLLITLWSTTVTMTTKASPPPPSYFKSGLCREEDVQFWRGQLGFHCIYKWADKKHVSHPQSVSMMGWMWRIMTVLGLDTQVLKREQSGGQDAAPPPKNQYSLIPKSFTHTHMHPYPKGWLAHYNKLPNCFYRRHWIQRTLRYPQFLSCCDVRKRE